MFLFQQRVPFCFSTLGNRKVFSLPTFLSPALRLVPSTWWVQRKCMVTASWAHRAKRLFSKGCVFSWIPLAAGCDTRNVEVMCVMLPGSTYSKEGSEMEKGRGRHKVWQWIGLASGQQTLSTAGQLTVKVPQTSLGNSLGAPPRPRTAA